MTGRRRIPEPMASCQWLDSIGHLAGAISTRESACGAGSLDSMAPTSIGLVFGPSDLDLAHPEGPTAPNAHASHLVSVTASITSCGRMVTEAHNCH